MNGIIDTLLKLTSLSITLRGRTLWRQIKHIKRKKRWLSWQNGGHVTLEKEVFRNRNFPHFEWKNVRWNISGAATPKLNCMDFGFLANNRRWLAQGAYSYIVIEQNSNSATTFFNGGLSPGGFGAVERSLRCARSAQGIRSTGVVI